eukprot:TRINITY_DN775_c0_g1_i5.p1 TRINITY_DN775_c0_g1~~TRINITY_DN775_c0_g1_i5.p1  ORF type:complete len:329 (-),score=132.88 TRINITY_DN775_c0_g1_i5:134-1120(-)
MGMGKETHSDHPNHRNQSFRILCTSIFSCGAAILGQFPSGGDFLRERMTSSGVTAAGDIGELFFSLSFFFIVIVIILNILFGIIVDTFAELRTARDWKKHDMTSKCFICDQDAQVFDRESNGFARHIAEEHPMFNYVHYLCFIKEKISEGRTLDGNEYWIWGMYQNRDTTYFPVNRSRVLEEARAAAHKKPVEKTDFTGDLVAVMTQLKKINAWMGQVEKNVKNNDALVKELVEQTKIVVTEEEEEEEEEEVEEEVEAQNQAKRKSKGVAKPKKPLIPDWHDEWIAKRELEEKQVIENISEEVDQLLENSLNAMGVNKSMNRPEYVVG